MNKEGIVTYEDNGSMQVFGIYLHLRTTTLNLLCLLSAWFLDNDVLTLSLFALAFLSLHYDNLTNKRFYVTVYGLLACAALVGLIINYVDGGFS